MACERVEVLTWLTGNFESPTAPLALCFSIVREPNQNCQTAESEDDQSPGGWKGMGRRRQLCSAGCAATGWQVGRVRRVRADERWTEPRMFAVPQTVHSKREENSCPSLIPRMGGSYGPSCNPC